MEASQTFGGSRARSVMRREVPDANDFDVVQPNQVSGFTLRPKMQEAMMANT